MQKFQFLVQNSDNPRFRAALLFPSVRERHLQPADTFPGL